MKLMKVVMLAIVGLLAGCGGTPSIEGTWSGQVGILMVELDLMEREDGAVGGNVMASFEQLSWTAQITGSYDHPAIDLAWLYSVQGEHVADCEYSGSVDEGGTEMAGALECVGLEPYSGPARFTKN